MRHHRPRPRSLAALVALAGLAALPACSSGSPAPTASAAVLPERAPGRYAATSSTTPPTPTPASAPDPVPTSAVPTTTTTTGPTTTTAATKAIGLPGDLPAPGSADSGEGDGSAAPYPLVAPAYGADDVVAALLASPNLTLQGFARQDLANGRVDPELTHLLLAITQGHHVTVSVFATGHSLCVHGGNTLPCTGSSISMHAYGRAADIVEVDGEDVSADSARAWDLLRAIVALPVGERPNEIGVPWRALDGRAGIFSDADHDHHLHVAFEPDSPIASLPEGALPEVLPPDVRCAPRSRSGSGSTGVLLLAADGRTAAIGGLAAVGDACADLGDARAVDVALTADCLGAWVLDDGGHVLALGGAPLFGDASGLSERGPARGDGRLPHRDDRRPRPGLRRPAVARRRRRRGRPRRPVRGGGGRHPRRRRLLGADRRRRGPVVRRRRVRRLARRRGPRRRSGRHRRHPRRRRLLGPDGRRRRVRVRRRAVPGLGPGRVRGHPGGGRRLRGPHRRRAGRRHRARRRAPPSTPRPPTRAVPRSR